MGCISSKSPVVAGDRPLCVEWSRAGSVSDVTLYGSTRTFLAPRLILTAPLGALDFSEVNVDDTVEMLPKSRRALTIQEIAALARSSLHGISQVVKDHVTKPTAMAQGRVAHLIEWKGWCKPMDTSVALESDFNSYSDLSEGEQEARFAAGVAEQFAIAEAKLRAWSSVDGDESNDDSYDEDFLPANEPSTQSTDVPSYPPYIKDLLHSQLCRHLGALRRPCSERGGVGSGEGEGGGGGSGEPSPTAGSPDTLCSSLCSLDEQHPLLRDLGGGGRPPPRRGGGTYQQSNAAELAAKILSALHGGEELLARLQRAAQNGPGGGRGAGAGGGDCGFCSLGGSGRGSGSCRGQDSPYSASYSEAYLDGDGDGDTPPSCKDYEGGLRQAEAEAAYPPAYDPRRRVSDVASSGVVSLDEEDEELDDRAEGPNNQ
ncbi:LOW QUALITY PROTEIN: protein FAM131A [Menidia menidia]